MNYSFENCIYKKKRSKRRLEEMKKMWKQKRISVTDDYHIISSFKVLPHCLFFCNIGDNFSKIPYLPNCRTFLNNVNEKLKTLKPLPKCKIFSCRKTSITELPHLPDAERVECNNNKITFIGKLPNCKSLDCHSNPIIHMEFNKKIKHLDCRDTLLKNPNVSKDCFIQKE